jgi:hypothetical protein
VSGIQIAQRRWAHCAVVVCLKAPYEFGHSTHVWKREPASGDDQDMEGEGLDVPLACRGRQYTFGTTIDPRGCKGLRNNLQVRVSITRIYNVR